MDVLKVIQEVVVPVLGRFVLRALDLHVVPDGFASLVEFDELLQSEVVASESVSEPSDGKSLSGESDQLHEVQDEEVVCVVFLTIVEDAEVEGPELHHVNLVF